MTIQAPPHALPSDGPTNPAFESGNPHVQYPFAEIALRDQATTSGGHEANATTPTE